jgi:hypothetical protein
MVMPPLPGVVTAGIVDPGIVAPVPVVAPVPPVVAAGVVAGVVAGDAPAPAASGWSDGTH